MRGNEGEERGVHKHVTFIPKLHPPLRWTQKPWGRRIQLVAASKGFGSQPINPLILRSSRVTVAVKLPINTPMFTFSKPAASKQPHGTLLALSPLPLS